MLRSKLSGTHIGLADHLLAHLRRRFYELADAGPAPVSNDARERIAKLAAKTR